MQFGSRELVFASGFALCCLCVPASAQRATESRRTIVTRKRRSRFAAPATAAVRVSMGTGFKR